MKFLVEVGVTEEEGRVEGVVDGGKANHNLLVGDVAFREMEGLNNYWLNLKMIGRRVLEFDIP
jgi:hypothetical protein